MIAPDDYDELDYQPRRQLRQPIAIILGTFGLSIFRWMFEHPYESYLPEHTTKSYLPFGRHDILFVVYALSDGLIEIVKSSDGYQLTADGRYYMAQYLEREAWLSRHPRPYEPFTEDDLGYASANDPDAYELMSRIQETY